MTQNLLDANLNPYAIDSHIYDKYDLNQSIRRLKLLHYHRIIELNQYQFPGKFNKN